MPNAKDLKRSDKVFKAFVVGPPGSGKSVFAASFPTPGFLFDFDGGVEIYAGRDWDYETYDLSAAGWVKFEKDLIQLDKDCKEGKYKTVVVDATTMMTDLAMERSMFLDPKRSATNGPLWNVHYQMVANLMEGKLRKIVNLPCNIVVIAHLERKFDQETGALISVEPLLTGRLSTKIPGYFSEVYYASTKTQNQRTVFLLQTVSKGFIEARSRLSGIEHYLEDFVPNNYEAIMKMYNENLAKKGGVQPAPATTKKL